MKPLYALLAVIMYLLPSCTTNKSDNMIEREISKAWKYQEVEGDHSGVATVPGTIHTDLLNNNQIEDPFYRTNEKDQQWIDKKDWTYKTVFTLSDNEFAKENIVLNFEGLDTYADVYFNGKLLLQSDNMFRQWELDIKPFAKNGENELKVYFHSPIKKGLELLSDSEYSYPAVNDQSENGGLGDKKVSVFTRKAGYHYGWDWGPRFVTSGIWRPVVLKAWDNLRINNVFIHQPSVTKELASLNAEINVESAGASSVDVLLKTEGSVLVQKTIAVEPGANQIRIPFEIENPQLWWSNGLGDAHIYTFEVEILQQNQQLAQKIVKTGLRTIKLVREADEYGESFVFELNGVKVFAKGANYIPNDSFLPRVTEDDYKKVIADAVNSNMNMLRVWGGGIYENDTFYNLCDENGILVWQDFMFACSMYPGDSAFLENVKQEAIDNVTRLRNHPSIALWCGNNEMNTAWHYYAEGGWGWKELYTKAQQEEITKAYLDIFHDILPKVVEQFTDADDYWPSSPQAGLEPQKHSNYESTAGDMHYWGVWHGKHPFEDFEKYKARFMSEYGFQSFPDFETVKKYALPEDYDIESDVMASHQRSGIGNLRIKEYMSWDYNVPSDFENFLYLSQVLQAQGTKMAIEAHRRAMPYCMGTLYWQINDCWPVASWSSTDYYHKWKAMHYFVKRAYEPVIVSAFIEDENIKVVGVSDKLKDEAVELKLTLLNFNGEVLNEDILITTLAANGSTVLKSENLNQVLAGADKSKTVLHIQLLQGEAELASNLFYFTKAKNQQLPEANLITQLYKENGAWFVKLDTDKLVRDVYLNMVNQDVTFSDNYFDLLPGESRVLKLEGSGNVSEEQFEVMHLQQVNTK